MEGNQKPIDGEAIVISGISGRFPKTPDVQQLIHNLYNKVDMIEPANDCDDIFNREVPRYVGKVEGMELFDSQFFRVTPGQSYYLMPPARVTLEEAFSAMFDAGINPETMKGAKLGLFVGTAHLDSANAALMGTHKCNGFAISGNSKTMVANRISYWMDTKGTSVNIDYECASASAALELACRKIRAGDVDSAIVGTSNHNLDHMLGLNMKRAGLCCLDGKTKCFDKTGDGYVRSNTVNTLFLQKAKDAKRIYAEVYSVKGKHFCDPNFSTDRNPLELEKFFNEFYNEIDVSPEDVQYVEANATGIAKADASELEAIGNVFAKDRSVKIGCVKSNMGHTEAGSGASALTKVCLAYQRGEIPANLHYNEPQNQIAAVRDGKLQVVTENAKFDRGFVAINNFSYTGANYHILLKGHYKPKNTDRYLTRIPRLILVSGRLDKCVQKMFNILENKPIDSEELALINSIFKHNIPGHTGRGYTILDSDQNNKPIALARGFELVSGNTRPTWFLFSGMGSQWPEMGSQLMQIPIFSAAIERCHKALEPKGLNLTNIITTKDANIFDNILNSFVGITAIQIGLTDVLLSIGIVPDNIIGHSVGEVGCAYADGSLTAEQAILASYYRGIVSLETEFIKGKMAAVGMGYKKLIELCPPEIDIACHNSFNSSTISGPADIVDEFISNLTAKSIFAKEVACSNIAFHSRYISHAGSSLLFYLKQVIKEPKLRSSKWLSTSYPPDQWDNDDCKFASAEYMTHNLMNPVCFQETASFIPNDAVIIEIAPHGLLQAIMKRSHENCTNIPLTRRLDPNNLKFFLQAVGKLYLSGLNPDIDALYPKVEFPVSTETPVLSHYVDWDHSETWPNDGFDIKKKQIAISCDYPISIHDDDFAFLKEYERNGVNVVPESAIIMLVWKTYAMYKGKYYKDLSITFADININKQVVFESDETLSLNVFILKGCSKFEVTRGDELIMSGVVKDFYCDKYLPDIKPINDENNLLSTEDVYKLLKMKGFKLGKELQSIKCTDKEANRAIILWDDDWTTFLDALFQFNVLARKHDGISYIKLINKLTINVDEQKAKYTNVDNYYTAELLDNETYTQCGGIMIQQIAYTDIKTVEHLPHNVYTKTFIPYFPYFELDSRTALNVILQIVSENIVDKKMNIQVLEADMHTPIFEEIETLVDENKTCLDVTFTAINLNDLFDHQNLMHANTFMLHNMSKNSKTLCNIRQIAKLDTFVIVIDEEDNLQFGDSSFEIITNFKTQSYSIYLLRKAKEFPDNPEIIPIEIADGEVKKQLESFYEQYKHKSVIGFINSLHCAEYLEQLRGFLRNQANISFFIGNSIPQSPYDSFVLKQLRKGLKINVFENGVWGGHYNVPIEMKSTFDNVELTFDSSKKIDQFTWTESCIKQVQVCYAGVSSYDCKRSVKYPTATKFGMDYSGIDSNGNRVMGLVNGGSLACYVEPDLDLTWPVPDHWSLEDAATVPLSYSVAYYCLAMRYKMRENKTVLVSNGASAVGQALICLSLRLNCTVFATVRDATEKHFLLKLFPTLKEHCVESSENTNFQNLMSKTCDLVINFGSGTIRKAAMDCVKSYGLFMDLSIDDFLENEYFGMSFIRENRGYASVRFENIFCDKFALDKKLLQTLIAEGIHSGVVQPLARITYSPSNISTAFQESSSKNFGKSLINMKDKLSLSGNIKAWPRVFMSPNKTYIVACDGSDMGLEVVDYLIRRGAQHITIHVKQEWVTGYLHRKVLVWTDAGVNINLNTANIHTHSECEKILINASKTAEVDGVFVVFNNGIDDKSNMYHTNKYLEEVLLRMDSVTTNISKLSYFAAIVFRSRNTSNILTTVDKCLSLRSIQGETSQYVVLETSFKELNSKHLPSISYGLDVSLKQKHKMIIALDDKEIKIDNKRRLETKLENPIGLLFKDVEKNEFEAMEPTLNMTRKLHGNDEYLYDDPNEPQLLIIPGFDGNLSTCSSICERLKVSCLGLKLSIDLNETIPEMAKRFLEYVKMKCNPRKRFYILGYSFGVNVALELAALMEKEDMIGVVFCLDSSPDYLRCLLDSYFGDMDEQQLQNSILKHMYKHFTEQTVPEDVLKNLTCMSDWLEKVQYMIWSMKECVSLSHQFLKESIGSTYRRIVLSRLYEPQLGLKSQLVLLAGAGAGAGAGRAGPLPADYGLSKYCDRLVRVVPLAADHADAPRDVTVPNVINGMLDDQLLQRYYKNNRCLVYFS